MTPIYNFGIKAYRLAVRMASQSNKKARLMLDGQARTIATLRSKLDPKASHIWIHASSLGEFEQGRPLIEKIKAEHPEAHIVLSFFSPSGFEVRKGYDKVDAVCYMPFDLPSLVKEFLDTVRPSMAIFVKYEFWGNYLHELKRRNVPTYLISAIFRPKQIFFRPWGGMFRSMLRCFTTIFVQNEDSRQLLKSIGVTDVEVSGDTRFDRVADIKAAAKRFPVVSKFTEDSRLTIVMGSSWQPDEDIVIPYFNSHPDVKLIIAPHEFDDARLAMIKSRISRPAGLYSQASEETASSLDCLIIDCFGILSSLYAYGQIAYVGGGFGAGIHNVNEAAVFGIPVVFGPKFGKFREASDLIACGGGFSITGDTDFESVIDTLTHSSEELRKRGTIAGNYIKAHTGATEFIYTTIFGNKRKA